MGSSLAGYQKHIQTVETSDYRTFDRRFNTCCTIENPACRNCNSHRLPSSSVSSHFRKDPFHRRASRCSYAAQPVYSTSEASHKVHRCITNCTTVAFHLDIYGSNNPAFMYHVIGSARRALALSFLLYSENNSTRKICIIYLLRNETHSTYPIYSADPERFHSVLSQ